MASRPNGHRLERREEAAGGGAGSAGLALRRIEEVTGVRRETASAYLKAAGVPVRPPRGWAGSRRQVDHGEGPMVRHPETGKYRRTRLLVITWIAGRSAGPPPASTARPSARSPRCSQRRSRRSGHSRSRRFVTTPSASARCTSTAAWRWRAPATLRRPAGPAARSPRPRARLPARLGLKRVDPLIRKLTECRDLIDRMTRSPEWPSPKPPAPSAKSRAWPPPSKLASSRPSAPRGAGRSQPRRNPQGAPRRACHRAVAHHRRPRHAQAPRHHGRGPAGAHQRPT